jgi:hypothetical protein
MTHRPPRPIVGQRPICPVRGTKYGFPKICGKNNFFDEFLTKSFFFDISVSAPLLIE